MHIAHRTCNQRPCGVEASCHPPSLSLHVLLKHPHIVHLHGTLVACRRWITRRTVDEKVKNETWEARGPARVNRSGGAIA